MKNGTLECQWCGHKKRVNDKDISLPINSLNSFTFDIVEVVNTVGPTLSGVDGLGDWNVPWDQWRTGNADV